MVLEVIKRRRSIRQFTSEPVDDAQLDAILDAGRWAPSFSNLQPWEFLVVKEPRLKTELYEAAKADARRFADAIPQAPVVIVTTVNPDIDRVHHVEGGAIATQNMALAATGLELGTCWIGVYNTPGEDHIKRVLQLPQHLRVVSLLPIGVPAENPVSHRKPVADITHHDTYVARKTPLKGSLKG